MKGLSFDGHAVLVIALASVQQAAFLWLKEDPFQNFVIEQCGIEAFE